MNPQSKAPDVRWGRRTPGAPRSPSRSPRGLAAMVLGAAALALATLLPAGALAEEAPGLSVHARPAPPPVVDRPLEKGLTSQTLGLARIASSIRHGSPYAQVLWGRKCAPDSVASWDEANDGFEKGDVDDRIFHETLSGLGFRVAGDPTDLFRDAEAPEGDLQVGALILDYSFSACGGFMTGEQKLDLETATGIGVAQMTVEWQVHAPALSRTIARIRTTVRVETPRPVINAPEALYQALLRDSLRALAADDDFRRAAVTPIRAPSGLVEPPSGEALRLPAARSAASVSDAHRAVAAVITGASLGSAFLVSDQGYLLTNRHVVGSPGCSG